MRRSWRLDLILIIGHRAAFDFDHIEFANLAQDVVQSTLVQGARLLEHQHLVAEHHERRNRANCEVG